MTANLKLALEACRQHADRLSVSSNAAQDHVAELVSLLDDALDLVMFIETEEHLFANRDTRADAAQARWDLRRSTI